jgi:PIN domain nuclease of toxin-antitoxin system
LTTVLLDTHALLWWQAGGTRLSHRARRTIDEADALLVSPLSCWEVATLERSGRISLDREPSLWVHDLFQIERISLAALSPEAAAWAGSMAGDFPGDPIDRLLFATARDLRVALVSKDERLHSFASGSGDVRVVW